MRWISFVPSKISAMRGVAPCPLDREVAGVAQRAMHLHRPVDGPRAPPPTRTACRCRLPWCTAGACRPSRPCGRPSSAAPRPRTRCPRSSTGSSACPRSACRTAGGAAAYLHMLSSAASAPPRQAAPRPSRPVSSVAMKVTKPAPTWPSTLAEGTTTSSKIISDVALPGCPSCARSCRPRRPGMPFSTMNAVTPPRAPRLGSVTASTVNTSAIGPLVI